MQIYKKTIFLILAIQILTGWVSGQNQIIINGDFTDELNGWEKGNYSYSNSGSWDINVTDGMAMIYAYYGNVAYLTQVFEQRMHPISLSMHYERHLRNTCNSVTVFLLDGADYIFYFTAGGDDWLHDSLNYISTYVEGEVHLLAKDREDLQTGDVVINFDNSTNLVEYTISGESLGSVPFITIGSFLANGIRIEANNGCYDSRVEVLGLFDAIQFDAIPIQPGDLNTILIIKTVTVTERSGLNFIYMMIPSAVVIVRLKGYHR